MPTPIATKFTEFEFTEAELYAATRFSAIQLMLIQTLIAQAATRKVNLKYDAANPILFAQQEAELQGEIGAYEHLFVLATESSAPEAEKEGSKADVASKPTTQG